MKISFLLERGSPPRANPVMSDVFKILGGRGVEVELRYPEEELVRLDRLVVDADLYVLKSDTEMALSLATALAGIGGRIINSLAATLLAKDKVLAAAVLCGAGIPTPPSFMARRLAHLRSIAAQRPIILKPHRGYHGVGIAVAERPEQLQNEDREVELIFAQEYLANARKDLKIFAIGEEIFGVRKQFSSDSFLSAGEPVSLGDEIVAIARRCGKAFGLELYGLDLAEGQDGLFVLDVNYFPGYRGVPDASRRLADYLVRALGDKR